jgi:glycosyltransferase involved in cell wall biosynthesis
MRILVITSYLPWPLDSGGNAAQFATLTCLKRDHRFTLIAPVYDGQKLDHAKELQKLLPEVTIRAVVCNRQASGATPLRTIARKVAALARGALDRIEESRGSAALDLVNNPFGPLPRPLVEAADAEIRNGYDLVQAEFAEMLQLAPWLPASIPKLFVHHQLHSVYMRRALEVGEGTAYSRYMEAVTRVEEDTFLRGFDGVITFSEADRFALLSSMPSGKVYTSPFPVPTDVRLNSTASGHWDGRFVFLASGDHLPNVDGLEWLLSHVWPGIAESLPSCSLHVVGKWKAKIRSRLASDRIRFCGFVPEVDKLLAGSIALVPLRVGSGIRVKILVAMASGIPVLSTSVGCEGLPVTGGVNILIADDPQVFHTGAVALATDAKLRYGIASEGLKLVTEHYSPDKVRQRRNHIYMQLTGTDLP